MNIQVCMTHFANIFQARCIKSDDSKPEFQHVSPYRQPLSNIENVPDFTDAVSHVTFKNIYLKLLVYHLWCVCLMLSLS